jgi:hypothetical protein
VIPSADTVDAWNTATGISDDRAPRASAASGSPRDDARERREFGETEPAGRA